MFPPRRVNGEFVAALREAAVEAMRRHTQYTATWNAWHIRVEQSQELRQPAEITEAIARVAAAYSELDGALSELNGICKKHLR